MSNLFSRLEDQQRVNNLREKARMMLDMEVVKSFFKYKFTGRSFRLRKYERYLDQLPLESLEAVGKDQEVILAF